jgi:hypothetical protein
MGAWYRSTEGAPRKGVTMIVELPKRTRSGAIWERARHFAAPLSTFESDGDAELDGIIYEDQH